MGRHAFLISAHNNFYVIEKLLELLDDSRNDIYVHVDSKTPNFDPTALSRFVQRTRLTFVPRHKVYWGTYSQVASILRLMDIASRSGEYRYYHHLSGADLPLKRNDFIHEFFAKNDGSEFVAFSDFPRHSQQWLAYHYPLSRFLRAESATVRRAYSRLEHLSTRVQRAVGTDRRRSFSDEIKYGSDWFSITDDLVWYLLSQESRIKSHFERSFNPVEFYLQTIVWNSDFRDRVYDFTNPYRSNMRLIDFARGIGASPYVWRIEDLRELTESDRLFARKFDPSVDREIIDELYLRNLRP